MYGVLHKSYWFHRSSFASYGFFAQKLLVFPLRLCQLWFFAQKLLVSPERLCRLMCGEGSAPPFART
jgi:hypothetical protein